ncbi:recombinase family protein [Aminipila butyrica]|uniref:Recombinase family protein n=1 Tax=Aminipila butyrica TaxID=433296 RepID=A0A858BWF6_9FIRM|nr:recombinase family protein [Aminipila butyrica]QIB69752.1 recombinase family protein [Aminipila butyrica]
MNRVAIYCRLSDEDRMKATDNQDSESIQNQKNLLMEYALEHGWEIYKLYSDDDWSGLDNERPEWNAMIADAQDKQFNIVLCKSQARFTRDMEMVEKYLHTLFPIWGIRFVGFADNADTENKGNKKSRQINGLVNEWYCEDISENIKVIFDKKRRDGHYIGGLGPYGLMKDPEQKGKLIIDPEAAVIVKRIFQLYLDGYGTYKIAKLFNDEGIPNPTKYKVLHGFKWKKDTQAAQAGLWNAVTVRRILKNEMYLGIMVQGVHKKVSYKSKKCVPMPKEDWFMVEGTHDAIIDQETFELVQKMLVEKRRSDGLGKPHVLAGKVKCADCHSAMIRLSPSNSRYKYLKCGMVNKKTGVCTGHYIRLDQLEELVLIRLKDYFKNVNEGLLREKCQRMSGEQKTIKSLDSQLYDLSQQIAQKQRAIEVLYMDRVNGHITIQQWSEMKSSFDGQLEALHNRKIALDREKGISTSKQDQDTLLLEKIKKYKDIEVLSASVVHEFIDFVTVGEKSKKAGKQEINIKWRY